MRQKVANQNAKKNFILYKGHTGWKIKTRLFGTLLVSLSAVAIAESTGIVEVHAATGNDAPAADTSSTSTPTVTGSATLSPSKTDGTTPTTPTAPTTPEAPAAPKVQKSSRLAAPMAESESITPTDTAVTPTDTTTVKQYQTLTPDQSMTVGQTDGSGVTLSGSQVQDHFTNTVQNYSQAPDPTAAEGNVDKNKTVQPADENGVWHLTSKDGHDFTSGGDNGYTMHNNKGPQTAHVSFENDIDFGHDFTLTGALGIGTKTSGGADGIGIVFAPGDPAYATTGKVGGNLGVGGLDNAFAFVYDDIHNDGSDDTKVVDPGTGAYFGWRSTDANGVIQQVSNSSDWKAASAFDLSQRATNPLIGFTMSYDSFNKVLTMTIQGQKFTRSLADIDTSKGYSISIAASTGGSSNDYSARIDSFTYTPKTATVSVNVTDSGDKTVSTKTPVTANIGDTISVFSTKAAAERAVAADPTLDPSLVTVIPASTTSNVYLVDGDNTTASTGTVGHITGEESNADAAYYSYKVTGDDNQAFSVPVAQAFKANVTPVDSVTGDAIPGLDPIQVTTVSGKPVVIQVPGYTPVTVTLDAPAAGETVANDKVLINTGTTPSTDPAVANPVEHYYSATGETMDGTKVTASATVGTNQSVTDALNATPIGEDGKAITDGSTPAYTWSTVPNAAGTDSTDSATPQDSKSILVPTKATLDKWLQKAADNQTQANTSKQQAQDIYDKFVGLTGITQEQKDAAKQLLDSVNDMYDQISTNNATAKDALQAAEDSTDPETIFEKGQVGYGALADVDNTMATFQNDLNNLTSTNDAAVKALATFVSWSTDYGQALGFPDVTVGADFGATLTDAQKAGFGDPANYYYVNAADSDTHVTPKDAGTYYYKLTDAGRTYLKSLTTNTNAGLYTSAALTINPVDANPTITNTSLQYGGVDGKLDGVKYDLGTVAGDDDSRLSLTQDDFEIDDAKGNQVAVKDLQAGSTYTIRYSDAAQTALKEDKNYNFNTFGTATLTVTPRKVTIAAADTGKTYGDSTDPALSLDSDSTHAALVNGDDVSSLGVVLTRATGENAGTYAITGTAMGNKNYTVTVTPGTFTIDKKAITVKANDVNVDYDGTAHQVDQSGFTIANGDQLATGDTAADLDVTLTPTAETDAGTYTIKGSSTSSNYAVTVQDGTLTIAQKAGTITADAATVGYGDALPTFTVTNSDTGLKTTLDNTDFEIFDNKANAVATGQLQAGGDYTIRLTQAAQNSLKTDNPNYNLTFGANKLTVTQRAITVHVEDGGKDYGVATDPTLTFTIPATTATGEANGTLVDPDTQDKLGVTLTRTTGDDAGKYTITGMAANDGNYKVSIENAGTFTIAPIAGTATVAGTSVVYGGTLPATVDVTVNGTTSALDSSNFETVDAVSGATVAKLQAGGNYQLQLTTAAQADLSKANPNYTLNFVAGGLTVTKRPIKVNINNVTANYDGNAPETAGFSIATDDKLVDGDSDTDLGVTLNPITATEVGTYTISGTANSTNYDVTLNNGTLKILGEVVDANKNVTTTEKDANGKVVKVVEKWADGSKTTYTYDSSNGTQKVTEESDGEIPVTQTFNTQTTVKQGNTDTTVTAQPGSAPTFTHDTTKTDGDTITTTDANNKVIKVVKTWNDKSKTTYTYDPSNGGTQTVTQESDGKVPVTQTFEKGATQTTVNQDNVATTVTAQPGLAPTFAHDTTTTVDGTTTTTDANDKVIKVVKQWDDGTQTTYAYDPAKGTQTVTEQKGDDILVGPKTVGAGTTETLTSVNDDKSVETTNVNVGQPGSQPTFEHETTQTDGAGNTTATTKDTDGNVVNVVKKWADGSQTTYTYDPTTKAGTVTEQKGNDTLDQTKVGTDSKATLNGSTGVQTVVSTGQPGAEPTFEHQTTATTPDGITTTTDANKNVIAAVKHWPDGSQTTYTYNPVTQTGTVTEQKDGKSDQGTINAASSTATVSADGSAKTIVDAGQLGSLPTFEHETTQTDKAGNVTDTTKDVNGNTIKVVKHWTDGSQTTYTADPTNDDWTVTEEDPGQAPVEKSFGKADTTATLPSVDGDKTVNTIVNAGQSGAEPTFEHETTQTVDGTTTTTDANKNVIQVVKQWPDDSKTTYTYDPDHGTRTVTEEKAGQTPAEKSLGDTDTTATLTRTDGDKTVNTIINAGQPGSQPTFEHETTDGDTTTTTDANGNVIQVVKKWADGSQTTYTYDPVAKTQKVTEQKDGKTIDNSSITTDAPKATLKSGEGVETLVTAGTPGAAPTFEHDTTKTDGNTTTTTDANKNVIQVVKKWSDGSKTTYAYNPALNTRTVTEEKNGKSVQQPIDPDTSKTTVSADASAKTIVNAGTPGSQPTFEHDTTATTTDKIGNVTATTKDDSGNVINVVKKWTDGSQTTYTYDPVAKTQKVTEQKDGKEIDNSSITTDAPKATLKSGEGVETLVTAGTPGAEPTFEHDTTKTDGDTTTTTDANGNVIKVVKQWPDDSQTTYTYDPADGTQKVTEVKDGQTLDDKTITADTPKATLKSGDGVETIVNTGTPGAMPTFEHDTTETVTDKLGNVTATTTDTDGNIVKVAQQWKDGSETIYTNDHGTQMVTELRNGKTVDQKPVVQPVVDPDNPDATKPAEVTLSDGAGGTATIKFGQDGVPTFTHAPAVYSAGVSAPTSETAADKIVTFTKQWSDGLQVVYTYDPVSGKRMIQELDNGKLVEQRTITPGVLLAVLSDGKGGSTTIEFDADGAVAPTYSRRLDAVSHYGAAQKKPTKKLDAAQNNNGRKQAAAAKPLAQNETTRRVNGALAAKAVATSHESQQNSQPVEQQSTELPQTGQKNEGFLAQLGALLLALLITPFVRRRSH
ncbi:MULTISPECIES: MBG domain-containing protein [Levilactobacillus]|uniref:lectin-like domain-containing protein n=1 Tax=Levilactobacillus TaxID=2767886 RepID=UPI0037569321